MAKLATLEAKRKDLVEKQVAAKKKWIKKQTDLVCLAEGRPIESDDPFHVFLKQM